MTTYNVLTTIVAGGLAEQPEQARLDSARAKGYSVAQLGPGSAHPLEEELLETWLLLEVRVSRLGSRVSAQHAEEEPLETWVLLQVGCWSAPMCCVERGRCCCMSLANWAIAKHLVASNPNAAVVCSTRPAQPSGVACSRGRLLAPSCERHAAPGEVPLWDAPPSPAGARGNLLV